MVPAFNTNSYGRRALSVVAPLLLNSLPQHIRDAGSLVLVLISLLFYFFSSLRRGDQSTFFCIVSFDFN